MTAKLIADVLVLIHFAFILFVTGGGFLVRHWRWVAWIHVPCALWGVLIEFAGWICPLTPLENDLRITAGYSGYRGGFIENYIIPIVYPSGLTHEVQLVFGLGVIIVNIWAYNFIWWHPLRSRIKNIN
jgi:hypothetical protein